MVKQTKKRPLYSIASDIKHNWPNMSYAAAHYVSAMAELNDIGDKYYSGSAETVVRYFLSKATTWRGQEARRIKIELKTMLGIHKE